MARRPRILFEGAVYHVTFRGNARQDIFLDVHDRRDLLDRLSEASQTLNVPVYHYCLMPNHVHLLLATPQANLNRFMGKVLTGYSVYFNRRHDRIGHVMQGRYGARLVSGDRYLLNLSRYIHLNPVKTNYWVNKTIAEKIDFLHQFAWSSYRSFIGLDSRDGWLTAGPILSLLPRGPGQSPQAAYRSFVESGLAENDEAFDRLLQQNRDAIGPETFIAEIRRRAGETDADERARSHPRRPPEAVLAAVRTALGEQAGLLEQRRFGGPARAFLARALLRDCGLKQSEIAPRLGVSSGAAICMLLKKHGARPEVKEWLDRLDLSADDHNKMR
ncbi:MAG TPA: transposase [Kiritimatiellia bacterium]|nr:transposase [Kiritimatiellia bacterium]HMO97597.1 transposase [Kiritimatiellia bacterium]HMP98082.1 transposase [Kiritimatiellia bacterium]